MRIKLRYSALPAITALLLGILVFSGCGGSGETNLETGLTKLKGGNYKAATVYLKKASEQIPDSSSAHCNLGIAYWKVGMHKEALTSLRKATQLCPEDVRPLEFQAQVLMEMQNFNEARGVLILADKRQPSSARILTAIALAEFRMGNNPQALAKLNQAIEIDPAYAPALYNMAVLQRDRLNNKEAASNYFLNYQKVAGNDTRIRDVPQFLNKVPPSAAPSTQPAQGKPVKQQQVDLLVANAKKAIDKQEFDSALEILKQAVKNNPNEPTPLWELAVLYDKHLKFEEKATDLYRKFAQQFPTNSHVSAIQKRIGDLQPSVKKPTKPETKPAQAKADPESAQKAFQEGLAYQNSQKWDDAIECYKRAFALDNSLAYAAYNLGLAYKGKGDINNAKQSFIQALAIDPNMTKARYMMAVIHNMQKENKQAVEYLNHIFRVDPDYAKAHHLMGVILQEENDIEGAKKHFEKYIKLVPDDPSAKTTQEWLNSIKDQQNSSR